jgi:hypothetical protein
MIVLLKVLVVNQTLIHIKKQNLKPSNRINKFIQLNELADMPVLHQLLSPIELAAYEYDYKAFTHSFNGVGFLISEKVAGQLKEGILFKLKLFHKVVKAKRLQVQNKEE